MPPLITLITGKPREHMVALWLNKRLCPMAPVEVLSIGGFTHTVVDCRYILQRALIVGASAFVMGHNHPSFDPEPSTADYEVTRALSNACSVVGVTLLDHIVVGTPLRYVSLASRGFDFGKNGGSSYAT